MALYHFSLDHIKRITGHTAIAAAAYRAGEKLYDSYYGETQDYSRKKGVVTTKIYAPDYVPERLRDRQTLWTEVEFNEHRKDAQLAYSLDIALQNELTMEENIELLDRFVTEEMVMILANLGQRSYNSRTSFPKYTDSVPVLSGQRTLSQRDKLAS